MHEYLSQQRAVGCLGDDVRIGLRMLHRHYVVIGGVQRQHRDTDLPVEDYVLAQIIDRCGIRGNPRCIVQSVQIGIEIQAGLLVQRVDLGVIN